MNTDDIALHTFAAVGPPDGEDEAYLFMFSPVPEQAAAMMPQIAEAVGMRIGAWSQESSLSVTAMAKGRVDVDFGGYTVPLQVLPDWSHFVARRGRILVVIGAEPMPVQPTNDEIVAYIRAFGPTRCAAGFVSMSGFQQVWS